MKTSFATVVTCVALWACSPNTTTITGSWKSNEDGAAAAGVRSILVTALTDRANVRKVVETDLAAALRNKGYEVRRSVDVMPITFRDGEQPSRDSLASKIKGTEVDAILTVALINQETDNRYVPGGASYAYQPWPRFGYYGTFWGYYNNWYPVLYSPGYYEETRTYFIETNLYHAGNERLIWSAQSETYDPAGLQIFSREFSQKVVTQMEKDGLL